MIAAKCINTGFVFFAVFHIRLVITTYVTSFPMQATELPATSPLDLVDVILIVEWDGIEIFQRVDSLNGKRYSSLELYQIVAYFI